MATITVNVKDRVTTLGIANGVVVLYDTGNNTQTTQTTDGAGVATFTNVAIGNYSVYNTYIAPNATPPTLCGFPSGYTGTTFARRLDVNVTTIGQANTLNFNFDKPVPWSSLNGGNPPNSAIVLTNFVNLATGALSALPANINNNGMGYSTADNMLYGTSGRSDTTTTVALNYPNTYTISGLIGDCDADGHFYTDGGTNLFTCIDVDPTRTTYLRALNPYNGFQEIPSAPFTVSYTQAPGRFNINDWSYVPKVSGIVSGNTTNNNMWILSLTTPAAYNVPIVGNALVFGGVSFSDIQNYYIPTGSQILKYAMSTTVANGSVLSASALSVNGDGARAVTAPVFYAQPVLKKTVSQNYGIKGDTLKFTVTIANTGLTTGTNTFFQDTVPDGLTFVPDTVYLDGVQQTGSTPSFVDIGTLPIGQVFTITFDAVVTTDTLPRVSNVGNSQTTFFDTATNTVFTNTFASNVATTTLTYGTLTSTKLVDKAFAKVGDTLTYTIRLENTGNSTINNCVVLDTTPSGTSFVTNSVKVNGTTITGGTLFPTGLNVGTVPISGATTVTFNVVVLTIPTPNPIPNNASQTFNYIIDTTTTPTRVGASSSNSNTVNTQVNNASLGNITKGVDKVFATCGDTLKYTITVPNSGNVTALNVVVKDTIPSGSVFVANSVTINGVGQPGANPLTGVTLPDIPPGDSAVITFNVIVQC